MSETLDKFNQAVNNANQLTKRPSNEDLLNLYGLYKQANDGDIAEEKPAGFDFKAIAKYDAWLGQKGKTKDQAMHEYIHFVSDLQKK